MGENVDSELLYDEFGQNDEKEFNENYEQDDLYDDVLTTSNNISNSENNVPPEHHPETETNGNYGNQHHLARRFQLYVGNLTWWTTDQDITDAVVGVGVNDFQEVKFFENRANGQSKGFCVITLGSESSMRLVMENLPKKELNGQNPVVTLPTKQALNQFESQQKTRPTPPAQAPQKPGMGSGMPMQNMPPQMHQQRMMNPNPMMRGPMPMQQGPMHNHMQRMPGNGPPPPMNHGPNGPPMNQPMQRFQNNWNGPPRPGMGNGMNRPPMMGGPPMMNQQRPMGMNQRPMGPRPDWGNRPPMHPGNFGQNNMNLPPRPQMHPINNQPPQGGPAPHVNPAFFNQNNLHPQNPNPMQNPNMGGNPPFNQQAPRPGMWPVNPNKMPPGGQFDSAVSGAPPPISEAEFEEIMGRNRTVSSSAIARAVSDAAAGEYGSAIETLATAISLIKQSKVANDERCKILINSLQDTLQGIEGKSYNRRERSDRSRSRERRRRRERSNSRSYSRRSRSREHREHRRDDRYYGSENYRSRSRDRGNAEHYRDESNNSRSRPRKSPEASGESNSENFKRSYEERDRDSTRYRNDRDRGETRNRH